MINSLKKDVVEQVREITKGMDVNYSVDTTSVSAVMKAGVDVLGMNGVFAPIAVTPNTLEINTSQDFVPMNRTVIGVLMEDAIPQLTILQLIQYYQEGKFPIDKLIKFYKFKDINQATAGSNSGKTIKPILIIDEDYRKDNPLV